jgi:CPA1 family monovalent cation:H+ antiporter
MSLFTLFAVLITVTALLSYLNEKFLRLPPTIGVMAAALLFSLVLALVGQAGFGVDAWAEAILERLEFDALLMEGMLSFLLFAGALHVNLADLMDRRWTILTLSTVGVILSTLLVGTAFYFLTSLLGLGMTYPYALLFGALISPTDPIAVLGILRGARAPRTLEAKIIGESLFNDGMGVVVFSLILGFAADGQEITLAEPVKLFVAEALGGLVFGFALGYIAYRLLRSVDNYTVEILLTLSMVAGGYTLAGILHTSGPIAMVVAGLIIGNHGRLFGMSERTREHLDTFWKLLDEILNALLFVMIGFEVLVLKVAPAYMLAAVASIPLILGIRFASVGLPISVLRIFRTYGRRSVTLLTWAGLRGGISIALALSIPPGPERSLILFVTYAVVVFSILVQGLTVGRVVRWAAE